MNTAATQFRLPGRWFGALAGLLLRGGGCGRGPASPLGEALVEPADLYVSPAGDDNATGESPDSALRTIQRALGLVTPGKRVQILPGTYHESIFLQEMGDPTAPITISGVQG